MNEVMWAILAGLKAKPQVAIFEPFLKEFGTIEHACILSEVCVQSTEAMQKDPEGHGWFNRTYDAWQVITGIPATTARDVCRDLAEQGFLQVEQKNSNGSRSSHFRAVPEKIIAITSESNEVKTNFGPCPSCKSPVYEGRRVYYCSAWKPEEASSCQFILWKNDLEQFGKERINHTEIRRLLLGKEIELVDLGSIKRPGTKFTCKGALIRHESGKYKIKLIFPEKKEASTNV